jgi:pentose-5-phosphate-3-epimerase
MTLTRSKLRLLVESVLLEGFKDDQRYLTEKYPDHADDLNSLPPKWISWLAARFGEKPTQKETHPFEDAIVTIKSFSKRDAGLSVKYAAPGTEEKPNVFKASVDEAFPPEDRSWSSPTDTMQITVDEMELILGLSERKKERFKTEVSEEEMESDRVGKVGEWNLWMPTTRERSCKIAGYDPVTRQPKTTWCTARMAGSNLFYNYTGRPGTDMTLFYIIRDNPADDEDWLSVGFINGQPALEGEHGGISVDRSNAGLTEQSLRAALGPDHDEIMEVLTEKNESLGGAHPTRAKISAAAKSLKDLNYLIKSLSKDEAADIIGMVIKEPNISPEVLAFLSSDKDVKVRRVVASNASTPAEALQALARDLDSEIRMGLVSNPSTPAKTLQELVDNNKNDIKILRKVASNPSTPAEALQALARDEDDNTRIGVANNPSTPAETLQELGSDPDDLLDVRIGVAKNPSTPAETLRAFGSNKNIRVLGGIAKNPSTPAETLRALANHDEASVLLNVAGNPSTPTEALQALASHANGFVRAYVSFNPLTSAKTLQALASDKTESVRQGVAKNPSTPTETLQALASDKDPGVRKAAANSLATRQQGLNERRLRQLIRQML